MYNFIYTLATDIYFIDGDGQRYGVVEMVKFGRMGRLGIFGSWTVDDALKMCMSKDYDGAIKVYGPYFKPSSTGFSWMARVNCPENANITLLQVCLEDMYYKRRSWRNDVGLVCYNSTHDYGEINILKSFTIYILLDFMDVNF